MTDIPGGGFRDYLDGHLRAREWTVTELARAAGLQPSVVGRWYHGETVPGVDNSRILAEALNVPLLEVLVAAGVLSEREAGHAAVKAAPIAQLPDGRLAADLERYAREAGKRLRATDNTITRDMVEAEPNRWQTAEVPTKQRRRRAK